MRFFEEQITVLKSVGTDRWFKDAMYSEEYGAPVRTEIGTHLVPRGREMSEWRIAGC